MSQFCKTRMEARDGIVRNHFVVVRNLCGIIVNSICTVEDL